MTMLQLYSNCYYYFCAAFILSLCLFYCNLQILFNVTIVIYICTSHILYFDESDEWTYANNHNIPQEINLKEKDIILNNSLIFVTEY